MTLDDYEELVDGLERGTVPAWFAAESAGPLGPLLTGRQLVRLAADDAYDRLDSRDWHPECAAAVAALLARCDRVGDRP